MTYRVGDVLVSLDEDLTPETVSLLSAHPYLFRVCLNSQVKCWLTNAKRAVHLFCDVIVIYATLLHKIPHYDDITTMAERNKGTLARLEFDFNMIFGGTMEGSHSGWERLVYEETVKPAAILITRSFYEGMEELSKCCTCVEIFFLQFDNLKKLLVPCLMMNARMVLRLIRKTTFLLELSTVVDDTASIALHPNEIREELIKIEHITDGIRRELCALRTVFSSLDSSLQCYTEVLLGKLILKRQVADLECVIVRRRDLCYQAAEHVLSIPLNGEHQKSFSVMNTKKHLIYLVSLMFAIILVILYRIYKIILG